MAFVASEHPRESRGRFTQTGRDEGADLEIPLPLTHVTTELTVEDLMRQILEPGEEPVLAGIGGSTAYGMATPGSDRDVHGIHLAALDEVLGLGGRDATSASRRSDNPDASSLELGKFVSHALKGAPQALELLWLPEHAVSSQAGGELLESRHIFLSGPGVRGATIGTTKSSLNEIAKAHRRQDPALAKRINRTGRHCFRFLRAGRELLETGDMTIDASSWADELGAAGDLALADPDAFFGLARREMAAVEAAATRLPESPDYKRAEALVVTARRRQFG